jgi:predicted small secreted protein
MKRFFILLLIASLVFISGCETFRGLGKDVEKAGNWVQKKAQ